MMFSRSKKFVTLFGIDVALTPSWVLIALLVTWSLSVQVLPMRAPGSTEIIYILVGFLGMILFFTSLVLHEFAHALVARRFGCRVSQITLFVFGGVAEMDEEFPSAREEFLIAIAGPIMSVCLALGFWVTATVAAEAGSPKLAHEILSFLALANVVLALFNLLPAFPLDGGRILRAVLWERSGDQLAATRTAAKSGVILSYVLIGIGFALLFHGYALAGAWPILIGLFVHASAKGQAEMQSTQRQLKSMTVEDLMSSDVVSVEPGVTLSALVNQVLLPNRITFVPVVDGDTLLGYIDTQVIAGIERENWSNTKVGDVFVETGVNSVLRKDTPALDLLTKISETGRRKFLVASSNRLRGVITLADVSRYLNVVAELERQSV